MKQQLQAGLDALNAALPPDMWLPHYIGQARHGCLGHRLSQGGTRAVSSPLEVREVYAYGWAENGAPVTQGSGLALLYKEGRCRRCGYVGRSETGRIVDDSQRPPLSGRVTR